MEKRATGGRGNSDAILHQVGKELIEHGCGRQHNASSSKENGKHEMNYLSLLSLSLLL